MKYSIEKILFLFKGPCMPIIYEKNIVQLSTAAPDSGMDLTIQFSLTLPYRSCQIRAIAVVMLSLRASMDCGLLAQNCDFRKPHNTKPIRVKSYDLDAQFLSYLRDNCTWKSLLQMSMACSAILLEPNLI